ncbi:MAG: hypothetical protein ACREF0_16840, partial [Acetobacteraceae bacterium]
AARAHRCCRASGFASARLATILVAMTLLLAPLAGCGKRGPPSPPGPPGQITFPKVYPTQ